MSGRRIAFLSMPLEALLDILTGRATAKLPVEVPEDACLLYSFVEPDSQTLKIAITHDKFELITHGGFIKIHKLIVETIPVKEPVKPEGYTGETLIGT